MKFLASCQVQGGVLPSCNLLRTILNVVYLRCYWPHRDDLHSKSVAEVLVSISMRQLRDRPTIWLCSCHHSYNIITVGGVKRNILVDIATTLKHRWRAVPQYIILIFGYVVYRPNSNVQIKNHSILVWGWGDIGPEVGSTFVIFYPVLSEDLNPHWEL